MDPLAADKQSDNHQALMNALGHPVRRELLKLVIEREEISPVEAASELDEHLSNVSYHMKQLVKCDAVFLSGTAPARGALIHFYAPNPEVAKLQWLHQAIGLDD